MAVKQVTVHNDEVHIVVNRHGIHAWTKDNWIMTGHFNRLKTTRKKKLKRLIEELEWVNEDMPEVWELWKLRRDSRV